MSIREDARRNLELAGLFNKDSDYEGRCGDAVMRLVNTHCDEGHSGASHALTIHVFNLVIEGKALTAQYWDEKKKDLEKLAKEHDVVCDDAWVETYLGKRPEERNGTAN